MARFVFLVLLLCAHAAGCASSEESTPLRRAAESSADASFNGVGSQPSSARASAARYHPPVAGLVVDGFRPPPGPFSSGNRGIEYETTPGEPVGAIGGGRVVFAGPVGGSRHVTVLHEDGLRSSYSYLESIEVAVGDIVLTGQSVGRATRRLHLGVRAGTAYLDPALLFNAGAVHLVPVR